MGSDETINYSDMNVKCKKKGKREGKQAKPLKIKPCSEVNSF